MEGLALRRLVCSPRLAATPLPLAPAVTPQRAVAADTGAGARPADVRLTGAGRSAYVLQPGSGRLTAFRVRGGRLVRIRSARGLPSSVTGLAVR